MADLKKDLSVPFTQARLKPYIGLFMYKGGYDGTQPLSSFTPPTTASIGAETGMIEIGSITKFDYKNARTNSGEYRTFNRTTPGIITETYPGLPTYDLSLETVVLYRNTFFEVLGYGAADVGYQDKPTYIQLQLITPGEDIPERVWTFRNCWFEENPYNWEASPSSEMIIKQTIKIQTAGVTEG